MKIFLERSQRAVFYPRNMMADAETGVACKKEKGVRGNGRPRVARYVARAEKICAEAARLMRGAHDAAESRHARFLKKGPRGPDDLPRSGRPPGMTDRKPAESAEK